MCMVERMVLLKGGDDDDGAKEGGGWVMDHRELFQQAKERKVPFVQLLEGSEVFVPPKPPAQARNEAHERRMEGLRRRKEQQEYAAMTSQPFAQTGYAGGDSSLGEDVRQIKQQVTLVVNVFVSVFATSFATWFFSAAWSPEVRILLCLTTALVVLVAEVGLYTIYVHRS